MHVLDTEVVGLIPQAVLDECAAHYLQLRGFDPDEQVIETLVARVAAGSQVDARVVPSTLGETTVEAFLEVLASSQPTPGGGTVGALSGATGAALLGMVARLTIGRKGFEAIEARMHEIVVIADAERAALLALADRDAAAFDQVMAAYRLPRDTDELKAQRSAAVQAALTVAAEVPLDVAHRAAALLPLAGELIETGNANAVSDGLSAAHVLHASVAAALANVAINVASLTDAPRVEAMRKDAEVTRTRAATLLAEADAAFAARLTRS